MVHTIAHGHQRKKRRISSRIRGDKNRPRITVFASNRYTYSQVIDDAGRVTVMSYSSLQLAKSKDYQKNKKTTEAKNVGLELARLIKPLGIKSAVFDRGRYAYKGRVKALAEGLREGGIQI